MAERKAGPCRAAVASVEEDDLANVCARGCYGAIAPGQERPRSGNHSLSLPRLRDKNRREPDTDERLLDRGAAGRLVCGVSERCALERRVECRRGMDRRRL